MAGDHTGEKCCAIGTPSLVEITFHFGIHTTVGYYAMCLLAGVWSSTKDTIALSAKIPAKNTGVPYGWNDMVRQDHY